MAVAPRDIPITRDQVQAWIDSWNRSKKSITLEERIAAEVAKLDLPDTHVNTTGHDRFGDSMPIADFIVHDLESYRNVPSGSTAQRA